MTNQANNGSVSNTLISPAACGKIVTPAHHMPKPRCPSPLSNASIPPVCRTAWGLIGRPVSPKLFLLRKASFVILSAAKNLASLAIRPRFFAALRMTDCGAGKGGWHLLRAAPGGPFRQKVPVPFSGTTMGSVSGVIDHYANRSCLSAMHLARLPRHLRGRGSAHRLPALRRPVGRGLRVAAARRARLAGRIRSRSGPAATTPTALAACGGSTSCCPLRRASSASRWARVRRSCGPRWEWPATRASPLAGSACNTRA